MNVPVNCVRWVQWKHFAAFFFLSFFPGNLQSPGVACGCMRMCMILCLFKVLWLLFCSVIIWCTLQNGVAAPGDQSVSNERPWDLQEIECNPWLFLLIQVLITAVPQDPVIDAWKCLVLFDSTGVCTSYISSFFHVFVVHVPSLPPLPDGSGGMQLKPGAALYSVVYLRGQSSSINGKVK